MPVSSDYLTYVLEQLAGLSHVSSRRMFGAVGLYSEEFFFGIIDDDVLYLRVDDSNREDYVSRGCRPFQPFKDKPELSMSYYEAPADVLDDREELVAWARRSAAVAAKPKPRKKKIVRTRRARKTRRSPPRRGR